MLKAGRVYVIDCNYIKPPKKKICLCFSAKAPPLFFFINTDPRLPIVSQFKLSATDHVAIKHDCFLDLSSAKTFQQDAINSAIDRGAMKPELLKRIKEAITKGTTLPEAHKLLALENLQQFFIYPSRK